MLDQYLQQHPRMGVENPGVKAAWEDPEYAAAVICGQQNRLSVDQVRHIRVLAATGHPIERITRTVGVRNQEQVERVLKGQTYSRIQ